LVGEARCQQGWKEKASFLIVDAQSVSNTDSANQKEYGAGRKVSGIKRHIAVDVEGLPHAIGITTANVTDRMGAIKRKIRIKCFSQRRSFSSQLIHLAATIIHAY